jgi:hypothetical protein
MYYDEDKTGPGFRFRVMTITKDSETSGDYRLTHEVPAVDAFFHTPLFCLVAALKILRQGKGSLINIWTNFPEFDQEGNKFFREWHSYDGQRFTETVYGVSLSNNGKRSGPISRLRFPAVPKEFPSKKHHAQKDKST